MELRQVIQFTNESSFIKVDDWIPNNEDLIFKHCKGAIVLESISDFYGVDRGNPIEMFSLSQKRSYSALKVRTHFCHYLNYFEKFYDHDRELLAVYYKIKFLIDYEPAYNVDAFIRDLERYILYSNIYFKVDQMNNDNYLINLTYRNKRNPGLQYTDTHGLILMKISMLSITLIPLVTHFIFVNKIQNSNNFLLGIYDILLHMHEDVDIYSKLYETATSNICKSGENHQPLWEMQDIRGNNTTTHSIYCVTNIILNIIPKYTYNENMVILNYVSINKSTGYQILDIGYEYSFISLSSSKRDEDNNSEFDKYESYLIKSEFSLYLQSKVACESTMNSIDMIFGPFDQEEIDFYANELSKDGKNIINEFQKELIFYLFYKYFGDTMPIRAINRYDYIKLMIAAKRILESNGMVMLPYILSARIVRLVARKNINKKELMKLEASDLFYQVQQKYRNPKIEKNILSIIATILSSDFEVIDYYNDDICGKKIEVIPELIGEEVLMYVNLI